MDSIKLYIPYTITRKYAVGLISVPVMNIKSKHKFKLVVIQKLMSNTKQKQVKNGMMSIKHYLW